MRLFKSLEFTFLTIGQESYKDSHTDIKYTKYNEMLVDKNKWMMRVN
jgi:hypothetical protein